MIANLFDKNLLKVISYFMISPDSRYRRKGLKEKTGINNVPLDNTINRLISLKALELHFFEEKNLSLKDPLIKEIKTNGNALF